MRKKDEPIIWTSKRPKQKKKAAPKEKVMIVRNEEVATVDRVEDVPPLLVDRTFTHKNTMIIGKEKKHRFPLKPVALAFVSALIIGSVFGAIVLKLFGVFGESSSEPTNATVSKPVQTVAAVHEEDVGITGYVLQAGAFTGEKSAKEWQNKFAEKDVPTYLWQSKEEYFLFIRLTKTEDSANVYAKSLKEEGIDVYVKQWEVRPKLDKLSKDEEQYLKQFKQTFENSLAELKEEGSLNMTQWQDLAQTIPKQSKQIKGLTEELTIFANNTPQPEDTLLPKYLLKLLDRYGEIGSS